MTENDSEKTYELELIMEASSKTDAEELMRGVFGKEISDSIKPEELTRKSVLYFLKHAFSEKNLSDSNYGKLIKSNRIVINQDELALARSGELLKICLPVEVQLKKNLTYIFPKIIRAFYAKGDALDNIEICRRIHAQTFGDTIKLLETDLASKWREDFLGDNGTIVLAKILNESNSFEDFKNKLEPYFKSQTIWKVMEAVLPNPMDFSKISPALGIIRDYRNRAAHPNSPILKKDFAKAKRNVEYVMDHISNLERSSVRLDGIMKEITEALKTYQEYLVAASKTIKPSLEAISQEMSRSAELMKDIATPKITVPNIPAPKCPLPIYDSGAVLNNLLGNSVLRKETGNNSANSAGEGVERSGLS